MVKTKLFPSSRTGCTCSCSRILTAKTAIADQHVNAISEAGTMRKTLKRWAGQTTAFLTSLSGPVRLARARTPMRVSRVLWSACRRHCDLTPASCSTCRPCRAGGERVGDEPQQALEDVHGGQQ